MKTTIFSKALEEVWEWTEKCYEESKDMSIADYLKKVHSNANKITKESGFFDKEGKLMRKSG